MKNIIQIIKDAGLEITDEQKKDNRRCSERELQKRI